jgi:predicted PurR-regulated permease PerM/methylmalonyl-CoA mutase cobalamin-binding subunit
MAKNAEVDLGKGSRFVVLSSVCIVVAALYFAQEVFVPLALAILFTFILSPLSARLERFRFPRVPAVLIVVGLALCLVGFLTYQLMTQVYQVANELPQYRAEIRAKVDQFRGGGALQKTLDNIENTVTPTTSPTTGPTTKVVAGLGLAGPQAQEPRFGGGLTAQYSEQNPLPVKQVEASTPVKTALEWAGGALHTLATAFLVLIFVIFMLLNREDLRDRMIRLVGSGRLNVTTQAVSEAAERISRYLLSLALVNLCYGICVAAGLWVIGKFLGEGHPFPNVMLWGLICGVSRFLPYVGTWVGAALPTALSFGLFPHYGAFFATAGMFVTYEAIVSQFIEPYFYGARTGISTIAVLASAVFWGWLWGPVGLILSTPLTVILVVVGKHVPQLQFLDIILGDEPVLEPPVRIYQRLLALDAEEAADLAREYLKTRSLEEVYGEILLPALALAEQDRHRGSLDAEREKFVRQNMRDLVEELSELHREQLRQKAQARHATDDQKQAAVVAARGSSEDNGRAVIPKGCSVNVVCLPAHDEADDIAGMMLAELLADRGYCAFAASSDKLASEMVQLVEDRKAHLVVISALPPAATAHARYICKRLHAKSAETNMIVGLWTAAGDLAKARDRITCDQSATLTTSFADALTQIQQLSQPVLVEANNMASATP